MTDLTAANFVAADSNHILKVSNLTKAYRTGKGIFDISFTLEKGTIMGIIGLNGAGKTTLLSCLTGFLEWDSGEVEFSVGAESYDQVEPAVLENLGIVAAEYGFPGFFTAKTVNHIMSTVYKNWDSARFFQLLERLDLQPRLKTAKYSTGMKTKLAIAIALSHNAKILVLDEATNGLDVRASAKVRELLHEHVESGENSIILTSHIMGEIERISDSIMFIDDGKVMFNQSRDDLLHQYKAFHVTTKMLEDIDPRDIIKIRKEAYTTIVIVREPREFAEKYAIEPAALPLDSIIEIFLEGDDAA